MVRTGARSKTRALLAAVLLASVAALGNQCPIGISDEALDDLAASNVNKYIGDFAPVSSVDVGDGWTKHTFDPDGGNGPICIAGTPYSVFTRQGSASKLLLFEQGGGACWQDFYFCNVLSEDQEPPFPAAGIWDFSDPMNPFKNHSIVYMPYCDGSVFSGDNDVADPNFPFGPVRFHRGLRNQTAGMDLGKALFPHAKRVTVSGTSAGGVGADGFAPFLVRFLYGNNVVLNVLNDAGPIVANLDDVAAVQARAADWQFGQFYPSSCTDCSDMGEPTAIIEWRLENDTGVREAWYETDGDGTNRFFLNVATQAEYRDLILDATDPINAAHPFRYKRFIKSGDDSHTALQTPLLDIQTVDGTVLKDWVSDFLKFKKGWKDLVEDFIPLP